MNIDDNYSMKSFSLLAVALLMLLLGSCGFFRNYAKGNTWSYFEEWDVNTDMRVDKGEFVSGCMKDGLIKKTDAPVAADTLFTTADENKDGLLSSLEFYKWKVHLPDSV